MRTYRATDVVGGSKQVLLFVAAIWLADGGGLARVGIRELDDHAGRGAHQPSEHAVGRPQRKTVCCAQEESLLRAKGLQHRDITERPRVRRDMPSRVPR